ncbi:protein of unknown function [Candidatus Nitrosocosmicus franklandus]|uniref:Uncharacterized protein n=1 Tax=Candidatus Nitrosocosmicus franklandianus TaxID=1798806 RepID=A0A484I3W2_9ARCH|nr:protein of unknown function [Candidatus Nitrosocosmicus franklandus]
MGNLAGNIIVDGGNKKIKGIIIYIHQMNSKYGTDYHDSDGNNHNSKESISELFQMVNKKHISPRRHVP